MMRVRPRPFHLARGGVGVTRSAHALDDPLREADPNLLVVVELGMPLEVDERRAPRVVVAPRVERQPMARAQARIALRSEIRSRFREGEVDVEHDGAESHGRDDSLGR